MKTEEVLVRIKKFYMEHGYPPTVRELMVECNYKSTSSVAHHMDILKERGEIIPVGKSYTVRGIKVSFDRLY